MKGYQGRILVCITHIFRQILYHKGFCFALHVGADEASQVQIGPAIQVQLVLEHLMDSICGSSLLWDLEFGDLLLAGIAGRVGCHAGNSTLSVDMVLVCFT